MQEAYARSEVVSSFVWSARVVGDIVRTLLIIAIAVAAGWGTVVILAEALPLQLWKGPGMPLAFGGGFIVAVTLGLILMWFWPSFMRHDAKTKVASPVDEATNVASVI